MALKPIVPDLEEVPEALREHYTEQDGKYVLAVDSVDGYALENVQGLKSTLAKLKERASRAEKQLEGFGDLDVEAAREAMQKLEELGDIEKLKPEEKVREQIEAVKRQFTEKSQKDAESWNADRSKMKSEIERLLVDSQATEAIAKHGASVRMLLPHVKQRIRVEEDSGKYVARVLDPEGNPAVTMKSGSTEPMGLDELVDSMRHDKDFSMAFPATPASGSGSSGSPAATTSGGNGAKKTYSRQDMADGNVDFEALAKGEAQVVE